MASASSVERYLGPRKYSYVPDGLISHIAPSPGILCSKCATLDYPSYFDTFLSSPTDPTCDDKHLLGTYEEILRKSINCDFCLLIIEALANRLTRKNSPTSMSALDGKSPNVYLDKAWSGSYFLRQDKTPDEPVDRDLDWVNVGCIVVYTDPLTLEARPTAMDSPDSIGSKGFIRLLANDAHLLGQQPMYHGRIIGNHISPDLLQTWIKTCKDEHRTCNKIRQNWGVEHLSGPRSLRYIDTKHMCLRSHAWHSISAHVTLSYVWGGSQGLQLLKANQSRLFKKGSLTEMWSSIPVVIQDAIELVRDLNFQFSGDSYETKVYLWVDQLCIVQDDPSDKVVQIQQMNHTYSWSLATIVAAEGSHSNFPLTRRKCHSAPSYSRRGEVPGSRQIVRNIQGLRMLAALPGPIEMTANSVWNTRAWTFQEEELSHSLIIFGKDQVAFRCAQEVFREDFVGEIPSEGYSEMYATEDQSWLSLPSRQRRSGPVQDGDWPETFVMYSRAVENYMNRAMTFPTDILPAFRGISQVLHALCGWKTLNGLIEDVIDFTLLWRPKSNNTRRRFESNGDPDQPQQPQKNETPNLHLPTYSWCAWLGPVTYQPQSYEIKSLIEHFHAVESSKQQKHKKRQVIRFSQNFHEGIWAGRTLEPEAPFAPQDCSYAQDFKNLFYFIKPQAHNLAHRMYMAKEPSNQNRDGPCILCFHAKCVRLVLSTTTAAPEDGDIGGIEETCRRLWLLDIQRRRVGWVWYIPALDEYMDEEVDVILLSNNKSVDEQADSWQFDAGVGAWDEWCLCNVMLIKRLKNSDKCERLSIGKIHERCADGGGLETINLV